MTEAARYLYDSLNEYKDLEDLISNGETEGLYLECKAPSTPQISRDIKAHLSKALSGFSNTAGGVIVWGISTTKHEHTGLDVLTQLEPVGNCKLFARQIEKTIPTLTTPAVTTAAIKTIYKSKADTRGLIVAFIPKFIGDPMQSNHDNLFYFRSGDDFSIAPFEMIKRLFATTDVPDLHPIFDSRLVRLADDGTWEVPIIISNESSAVAENVKISVIMEEPSSCESIKLPNFNDASSVNPGQHIYMRDISDVIHRGLSTLIGTLYIKMKVGKRPKRLLKLSITLYANKMRARKVSAVIQLAKKGFSVAETKDTYIY